MLALGFVALNPTCDAASALTSEELEAGSLISSVSISFAPSAGSTTLSPTGAAGTSGLISVLANVGVTNSGGYSVYLGSNSTNLVGKNNASVVIPGVSGEVSFDNLQDNTWGYYAGEGSSIPENATYKAISQGQGNIILTNNNSRVKNENKTFVLGFAAKINNSIPADTYENQVTLSVVSNPYQLTLMDIDNMQDMTSQICENTPGLQTKQLKDVRDGKYYWVTKLADNKCWMTQNLDLDLNADTLPLTSATSDISDEWAPPTDQRTTSTLASFSSTVYTEMRSWDQGLYVLSTPTTGINCGNSSAGQGLSDCYSAGFVDVSSGYTASTDPDFTSKNGGNAVNADTKEYDAHYLVGNWYQWNAATAGTGGTLQSTGSSGSVASESNFIEASSSICPKGWHLPKSGRNGSSNYANAAARDDSFKSLLMQYNPGGTSATTIESNVLTQPPLFFVRSGYVGGIGYVGDSGNAAYYWSSTADTNTTHAYRLTFTTGTNVSPSSDGDRYYGFSVRCIAR